MISDEFKQLFPSFSEEELLSAQENLDQYLLLVWEIMQEAEALLTTEGMNSSIETKVDASKT